MSQTPPPPPPPQPLPHREPYSIDPPPEPKARIDRPGLTEGFEEDADFTSDPELERVVAGKPLTGAVLAATPSAEALKPEFVTPAWAWEHTFWGAAGAVLLVAAMVASGINITALAGKEVNSGQRVLSVLLTLYSTLLHTGTGVAALLVAAHLQHKRLGRVEVGAARMFAAVAAFVFAFNLNMTLTVGKFEETVVGALVYLVMVALTFRLFTRELVMYVVGAHFMLWLIVTVGMELSRARG